MTLLPEIVFLLICVDSTIKSPEVAADGGDKVGDAFPTVSCLIFCAEGSDCSWLKTYSLSAFTTACKAMEAAELLLLCLLDLLIGESRWSDGIEDVSYTHLDVYKRQQQ